MSDMRDWRDKDDLELTVEDVDALIRCGKPVDVHGPEPLPGGGHYISAAPSYGGVTIATLAPPVPVGGMKVSPVAAH